MAKLHNAIATFGWIQGPTVQQQQQQRIDIISFSREKCNICHAYNATTCCRIPNITNPMHLTQCRDNAHADVVFLTVQISSEVSRAISQVHHANHTYKDSVSPTGPLTSQMLLVIITSTQWSMAKLIQPSVELFCLHRSWYSLQIALEWNDCVVNTVQFIVQCFAQMYCHTSGN